MEQAIQTAYNSNKSALQEQLRMPKIELEHADPKDLIASMCRHEAEVQA